MTPSSSGVGERLKSYVLGELESAERLLGRGGGGRQRGIHAARKAIRRARAALRLARKPLGKSAAAAIDAIGEVGTSLSAVRDAHVAVKSVAALRWSARSRDERESTQRVGKAFAARRAAQLAELLARDPALAERRARLRGLRDAVETLRWSTLGAHDVELALERSMRRCGRIGELARDSQDGDLRHRWRRRLRRLRYQLKAAARALGRSPGALVKSSSPDRTRTNAAMRPATLRDLTDTLGVEHDLRVLLASLSPAADLDNADRNAVRRIVRRALATNSD